MNVLRKGLSLLLTLAMVLSIVPVYAVPETVEPQEEVIPHKTEVPEGYKGIYSKADLNNVRNNLTGKYILMCDLEFTDADYKESGAYYNNDQLWEPIGANEEAPFAGIFDGNNYVIRNLQVYSQDSQVQWNYAGLFGCNTGTIHNLGLEDGRVVADDGSWAACAGAIVGLNAGTIRECYNTGSVYAKMTATEDSGYRFALAAGIAGRSKNGVIDSCWNSGTVFAEALDIATYPIARAAGITAESERTEILRCTNTGYIRASGVYRDGTHDVWVGGIAGSALYDGNQISQCSNLGAVEGNGDRIGGIAGYNSGAIENCYNAGRVRNIGGGWHYFPGGIVGVNMGSVNCCYNVGEAKHYSQYWRPNIGLVGCNQAGSYQNCYYPDTFDCGIYEHEDGDGRPLDVTDLYIGKALTDEEMRQRAFYKGFDFTNIWTLEEDGKYPYPVLKNVAKIRSDTRNFAGGRGTQADPYRIATAEHLSNMRKFISAYYVLAEDIAFADGQLFETICMEKHTPFAGHLDGAGYTIENLQIAVSDIDGKQLYVGMFGYLTGTVKDLELKGGYVRADVLSNTYYDVYVGALAGNADGAQVENVVTSCRVDAVATTTEFQISHYAFAGGIVGYSGTLRSCLNGGQVTSLVVLDTQYAPTPAYAYAGGIAARNAQIENCTNTGAVLAQVHSKTQEKHPDYWYYGSHQGAYAGGIVASTNRLLSGCSNLGTVDARSTYEVYCDMPHTYAGGIVASYESYHDGDQVKTGIVNCANAGAVTATDGIGHAGGIAYKVATDNVQSCSNSGAVTAATYAGGIVCESGSGTLSWCRNVAPVAAMYAGGLVYTATGLTVSHSSNEGAVTTERSLAGVLYTGSNNVIENCYNTGNLVSTSGDGYAFGIASGATVKNCYNVGHTTGSVRWAYGIGDGTSENCYYIDTYETEDSAAVRCTAEQLQNQATYAGFDFEEVWTFAPEGGYPVFQGDMPEVLENTVDFLGGYGTAEHPFLIANATHLNNIRRYLGSYFRLVSNIEFTDADFAAGGQFHNDGAGWLPIGADKNAPFVGQLDGAGFTIYNLKINKATGDYIGLLGVNWGTVKDLTLAETEIFLNTTELKNHTLYVGGIAGYSTGVLENLRVTGSITEVAACQREDSFDSRGTYMGGIAGHSEGNLLSCNNAAKLEINIQFSNYTDYDQSQNQSGGARVFGGVIYTVVGGIVGRVKNATINECHNYGAITVTLESSGSAPLSCDQSCASAAIGGIVGYASSAEISLCANMGDITGWANNKSSGKIENSTARASVTAGGIAGELPWHEPSMVTACSNVGNLDVSAIALGSNVKNNADVTAGGLIAYAANTPITDCYNAGDIKANISAAYNGSGNIGGIVGTTYVGVSTCYSIGYLTAEHWSTHKTSSCDMGAIAGAVYSNATLTDCYYLDCMSAGAGFGTDTAVALTCQQMMDKGYYSGFNFNTVWTMVGNQHYAFPELYHVPVWNYKWVVGLVFTKQPDQTEYMMGLEYSLDMTGAEVVLLYSDGSTEPVNLSDTRTRGFESGQLGEQTVYLTWDNYETSFKITVVEPVAESLEILQLPDKLEYEPGEELDLTGLSIKAHYANGDSRYADGWEHSEVDVWAIGEQTVTITYQGVSVQFTVVYKSAKPDSVTSDIYTVGNQYVTMVPYGTKVGEFLENFNETEYLYVFSDATTVSHDTLVGTGMELMLNGSEEVWLTIIVTGDVNGDGKITVTDLLMVKAHLLGKSTLIGAQAKAADTNGSGTTTITDYIQFKSHLLEKSQITPN